MYSDHRIFWLITNVSCMRTRWANYGLLLAHRLQRQSNSDPTPAGQGGVHTVTLGLNKDTRRSLLVPLGLNKDALV